VALETAAAAAAITQAATLPEPAIIANQGTGTHPPTECAGRACGTEYRCRAKRIQTLTAAAAAAARSSGDHQLKEETIEKIQ